MTPAALVGLLAEPARLRVAAAIVLGAHTPTAVAAATGLDARDVARLRYAERDVDAVLRAWHDDHAALRRYLVDEGLLGREANVYWRTGGSVDLG